MKINPIYRQETRVSARSFRFPMVILIFNCVLALVALLDMYSVITQVRQTAEIQYTSFLELYFFVASVEFIMILLITPALTSGSISGEREKQTLDLMLTTQLVPRDIVLGKLLASLSNVLLLMVSSFPVLALVFIYGGVTAWDVAGLLACYGLTALVAGCIGIFCSCISQRSTIATVAAYSVTGILTIGTLLFNWIADRFVQISSGGTGGFFRILYLFNPVCTFERVITRQMGEDGGGLFFQSFMGGEASMIHNVQWDILNVAAQLLLAFLFLWLAVRAMDRQTGRRGGRKSLRRFGEKKPSAEK